jgi:hypothetical protein
MTESEVHGVDSFFLPFDDVAPESSGRPKYARKEQAVAGSFENTK